MMHIMMKANPKMMIAEALGEGQLWECRTERVSSTLPIRESTSTTFHTKTWSICARRLERIDTTTEPEMEIDYGRNE
jgi:hypothetical protein